jgi:glycosyltransferase involved in cell wall biosynthesis
MTNIGSDQSASTASARVAIVVPCFPKLSETFVVSKFLGLLDRGWDVHVVCGESDRAEWDRCAALKSRPELRRRVHTAWPHRPHWLAALLVPLALVNAGLRHPRATRRYVRLGLRRFGLGLARHFYLDEPLISQAPNLIHFEFGSLAVGRMYLKELLDCKTIVSFRGFDLNCVGLDNPDYYREVWEEADALHLLGGDLWRCAQRRHCPSDKPRALVTPAIDLDFFDPGARQHTAVAGTPERPLHILSVGRLEWKKGYDYALEAVKLLQDSGVTYSYRIIGDGEYLESVSFAKHQLRLSGVELLGARPRAEVRDQMLTADIFLHAAVSEGFCNAVVEAAAMRLPVVSSDAGGLSENVVDGETGFVVPRRDANALCEKMALLASHPQVRQALGQAGRERARTQFRLEQQISAFNQLYQRVISLGDATDADRNRLTSTSHTHIKQSCLDEPSN